MSKSREVGYIPRVVREGPDEVGRRRPSRVLNARLRGIDFVSRTGMGG